MVPFIVKAMLSIVIPTLNEATRLERVLAGLGAVDFTLEIIISDGGSTDTTLETAQNFGTRIVAAPKGRGQQLAAGADACSGAWLLFLHADTVLGRGWRQIVDDFLVDSANLNKAGIFKFALDDPSPAARRLEKIVHWRSRYLGLPYGDQGLLISRAFYNEVGGFRAMPLYEDVDIIRRIGRQRQVLLDIPAVTSATRYHHSGYFLRPLRNFACLSLYFVGLPPRLIGRLYQ